METQKINELIEELKQLSENEKQNMARMKEIAKVLVAHYMWTDKKQGKNSWKQL